MMWTARLPKRSWSFLPKIPLRVAPMNGKSGMSQSQLTLAICCTGAVKVSFMASVSQGRRLVRVDGVEVTEDRQHDRERDRRLGCRKDDDEEREHLTGHEAVHVMGEGDEVERR